MDSVQDILSGIKLLTPKLDVVSTIRIGGVTIDEPYLTNTKAWAEDLAQKLGLVDAYRHDKQEVIEFKNRVITLCGDFIDSQIRRWVDVVYFDDPQTQEKFSSSYNARLRKASTSQPSTAEIAPEENLATAQSGRNRLCHRAESFFKTARRDTPSMRSDRVIHRSDTPSMRSDRVIHP